jgi:A/G-specific adenine glycosylase
MPARININNSAELDTFRGRLLKWYCENRRALPWRASRNPYRVWVSEIMLQQTRVAAVLEHYRKFLARFPRVQELAAASEAEVLTAWSGLGYYRRARMMHRAARVLAENQKAALPRSAAELRELPGIGRYTANAIASIAFGEPVAVVDGNVERVLTRLLGKDSTQAELWEHAQNLLDRQNPGDFNQAMMELGATICLPSNPICGKCPVKQSCSWTTRKRLNAKVKEGRTHKSESLAVVQRRGNLLLRQRPFTESLMPGMWELPRVADEIDATRLFKVRHSITTTDWTVSVFAHARADFDSDNRWIPIRKLPYLPLTGLTRKILRKLELLA